MEKTELVKRIESSKTKIEKLNKKISKWEKANSVEGFKNYWKDYLNEDGTYTYNKLGFDEYYSWRKADYEKECLSEIKRANFELVSATSTLEKYVVALEEKINFEEGDKIEVIMNFLKKWKGLATEWYLGNAKRYIELKDKEAEALEQYKIDKGVDLTNYRRIRWQFEIMFSKEYYSEINGLTREIVGYKNVIDTDKLEKVLDKEVEAKYKDLVLRVTKVVGEIKDAGGLSIGNQNGEINGTIKGLKGICEIKTISAGGYNIQCFHYRVLINRLS